MKAISLWQPWASLLAHSKKQVETRSWPYRGPLPVVMAIHAAKKWGPELAFLSAEKPFRTALEEIGIRRGDQTPFGAVVGLGVLLDCRPTDTFLPGSEEQQARGETFEPSPGNRWSYRSPRESAFGDYGSGRYGWVFRHLTPLPEPIPLRGYQQVWQWDAPADVVRLAGELLSKAQEVTHA